MAIANLAAVAELIKEFYETPFVDARDRSSFLYDRLGTKPMENDKVEWKIHYAGNTAAGSYAEGASIPTAVAQSYLPAQVSVTQNWVPVEVTGLADAATSNSNGSFMNALATETTESMEDLIDELETQLLKTGAKSVSTDLDSLPQIISDSGSYAGIVRSTYQPLPPR